MFMACRKFLKEDAYHEHWHDLESVFWVLLYMVMSYKHTTIKPDNVQAWHFESPRNKGYKYVPHIFDPKTKWLKQSWIDNVLPTLEVTGNPPLTTCLIKLGGMVRSQYYQFEEDWKWMEERAAKFIATWYKLTHKNVINTIQEALDSEGWPDENEDGPTYFPVPNKHLWRTIHWDVHAVRIAADKKKDKTEPVPVPAPEPVPVRRSERIQAGTAPEAQAIPAKKQKQSTVPADAIANRTRNAHRREEVASPAFQPRKRLRAPDEYADATAGQRAKRARTTVAASTATRTRNARRGKQVAPMTHSSKISKRPHRKN